MAPRTDARADFQAWAARQDRLYRVGGPILTSNTALCPNHARNLLGFTAKTKHSYSAEFSELAQSVLGLDERLRVTEVLRGGSAALAGIQEGDILLAAGIEPMPEGLNAERKAAALIASELQGRSDLDLTILRGEERMTVTIPLAPACAMKFEVGRTDAINAISDGMRVMITRGMMDFVQSEDELAYIIAREVAYNALHPGPRTSESETIDRLRNPFEPGHAIVDGQTRPFRILAPDPHTEELALYMLARAGYSLVPIPYFLQRLRAAVEIGGQNEAASNWSDRLSAISGIAGEIETKKVLELPLVPGTEE